MNIRIRSLFLKIFFWFWATVIATGIALVATWIILQPKNVTSQSQTNLADVAWVSGTSAVDTLERQGPSAASAYIGQVSQKTHVKSCLFDTSGNVIAGSDCAIFRECAGNTWRHPRLQGKTWFRPRCHEDSRQERPRICLRGGSHRTPGTTARHQCLGHCAAMERPVPGIGPHLLPARPLSHRAHPPPAGSFAASGRRRSEHPRRFRHGAQAR